MKAILTSGSSVGQDDSFPHKLTGTSAPRDRGHRTSSPNVDIAGRLDEVANIFVEQGANRFRIQAYRRAANVLRRLSRYAWIDRKSTRLNSSHRTISYAVFCL